MKHRNDASPNQITTILSEMSMNDQNLNETNTAKSNATDSIIGRNSLDSKLTNNRNTLEGSTGDTETRKKRYNTDRGYFIAKELLSTERTYKKDLDVINIVSFVDVCLTP